MLTPDIEKKIEDFVFIKPRSIDEIAKHIKKNWRTCNRYIEMLSSEKGLISTRVFREGTRGSLKLVFWTNLQELHSTSFQQEIFDRIIHSHRKMDFNPFDIYQHVTKEKKKAFMERQELESKLAINKDLPNLLKKTEKQLLIFSGNLSWARLSFGKETFLDIIKELAKKKIKTKIITRVDLTDLEIIKKVLAINDFVGSEMIEIKHREQPLRAVVIDNKIARFKQIMNPEDYQHEELKKKTFIFYNIYDKEWIEWVQKIFWELFSSSVDSKKRIKEFEQIKEIS